LKYAVDRVVALVAIIAMTPILLVVALGVKLSSPGSLLFRQRRIGRDGQEFGLLKFRSMSLDDGDGGEFRPPAGSAPGGVAGMDRRTPFGRFCAVPRSTSYRSSSMCCAER